MTATPMFWQCHLSLPTYTQDLLQDLRKEGRSFMDNEQIVMEHVWQDRTDARSPEVILEDACFMGEPCPPGSPITVMPYTQASCLLDMEAWEHNAAWFHALAWLHWEKGLQDPEWLPGKLKELPRSLQKEFRDHHMQSLVDFMLGGLGEQVRELWENRDEASVGDKYADVMERMADNNTLTEPLALKVVFSAGRAALDLGLPHQVEQTLDVQSQTFGMGLEDRRERLMAILKAIRLDQAWDTTDSILTSNPIRIRF